MQRFSRRDYNAGSKMCNCSGEDYPTLAARTTTPRGWGTRSVVVRRRSGYRWAEGGLLCGDGDPCGFEVGAFPAVFGGFDLDCAWCFGALQDDLREAVEE